MNPMIMLMLANAHNDDLIQARRSNTPSALNRLIKPVRRPRRRPQA